MKNSLFFVRFDCWWKSHFLLMPFFNKFSFSLALDYLQTVNFQIIKERHYSHDYIGRWTFRMNFCLCFFNYLSLLDWRRVRLFLDWRILLKVRIRGRLDFHKLLIYLIILLTPLMAIKLIEFPSLMHWTSYPSIYHVIYIPNQCFWVLMILNYLAFFISISLIVFYRFSHWLWSLNYLCDLFHLFSPFLFVTHWLFTLVYAF